MYHCDFLVIGAGPTGMGAAVRLDQLGQDYLVVDAADRVGGMAASSTDKYGFTWDFGGHVLHSHFVDFDKAIAATGVDMNSVRRNGWVWMNGRFVRTPLQQNLDALPADIDPQATSANLAEYYRHQFGRALCQAFFYPYTFKMWATPLDQIGHSWTSLRSGSGDRNVPPLGLARDFVPTHDSFPYPADGGTGALWRAMAERLTDKRRILLSRRVVDIDANRHTALLADGRRVRFERCISSAPIGVAMRWIGLDTPRPARPLVASKVHVIGLGFRGNPPPELADKTWLYCPDPPVPWYRATLLSNYAVANAGAGRWNILFEVSTSPHQPWGIAAAIRATLGSVERLGGDLATLVTVWHRTVPMGYPVPTVDRDDVIRRADDELLRRNIHSRGRFGGWRYESCNQDYSFVQGTQAVDNELRGDPEDAYWHPERF